MDLNVLYIGCNASEWAQMNRPVSLAGAKWSRGFLTALSRCCNLTVLTHSYEVAWPKGKVFWRGYDARLYSDGWTYEAISYPVLKYIREIWWRFAYAKNAKRIIRDKDINVVLIYNCYEKWQVPVLREIKREFGEKIKVVPLILDGDDPRKDDWGWIRKAARWSDAFVPVSWWVCENLPKNIPNKPVYHFDGGADAWWGTEIKTCEKHTRYTLVHTGALDKWRGLDFMTKVMDLMRDMPVTFVFCGKSCEQLLKRWFGNDPMVELPGFVTEERMRELCNGADVLLNVREPSHPDNILNYPSKLPHYLSFGRPVVSTRLQSLSPDYREVVHYPEDDTPEAYVAVLKEVLQWDMERKVREYNTIKKWFLTHKRWDGIVMSLVRWIREFVV